MPLNSLFYTGITSFEIGDKINILNKHEICKKYLPHNGHILAAARNDKYTRWICKCSCGKEVEVRTDYLTSKHTTSCGHIKN